MIVLKAQKEVSGLGERLLKTLIELYAEQNGATITYEFEETVVQ